MKYCPNCKHKLRKDDKFCPNCGKKLIIPTKKKVEEKPKAKKVIKKLVKEKKKPIKKIIKEKPKHKMKKKVENKERKPKEKKPIEESKKPPDKAVIKGEFTEGEKIPDEGISIKEDKTVAVPIPNLDSESVLISEKPEKKEKLRVNKVIYGYLAMISFFLFTILNMALSERVTDMSILMRDVLFIGGAVFYFAWFGLGLYFLKDEETRIHGLILFILWLIFGMKSITHQTVPWYERIFK